MSLAERGARDGDSVDLRTAAVAVGACSFTQTLASLTLSVPSVIAPVAAAAFGASPAAVGYLIAPVYVIAIFAGLLTPGLLRRFGGLRLFQVGLIMLAGALLAGTSGWSIALPLCVLLVGIPYGVINPVSSHVLSMRSPKRYLSTVFAIKQTGVPIGSMAAGIAVPPMLLVMRWETAVTAIALLCLLMVIALQPLRALYDADRDPRFPVRLANIVPPVVNAWSHPALRELAIVSATYSFVQVNLTTFLVSYFNLEVGYTLVAAGFLFACAQLAGVTGRVWWGAVADRWASPRVVLGALGLASAGLQLLASLMTPAWPFAMVALIATLLGGTAIAWNGVHFAEIARRAPPGEVTSATGGVQFFTFGGALLGPIAFSSLVSASGSYALAFAASAVLPLIVGVRVLRKAV